MSRIHEALKKAEQERAGNPADTAVAPAAAMPVVPAPPEKRAITLERILESCAPQSWKPNEKLMPLFDGTAHAVGTEELRTLRSRLYQVRDTRTLRTVLITSALPAEGKTFLTCGLAMIIIRQHERRALIIDADLRNPQVHTTLGASSTPGLSDYLMGQADELQILQRGPCDNLFLIPGGTAVSNPAELLSNGRMKILLTRLAPLFDWVLVDSAPVVPVSDAVLLAADCDGTMLVVESANTPFDLVQRARDQLRDKNLLGVILNKMEPGATYHSYYYGYNKSTS